MSKKKGLSHDEKRAKMMELFYEKKEFFQMKELEKLGPKEKGVVSQSVKEVVQSLVDDGLVDTDKIGTFVCFWAFPSKALNSRETRLKKVALELEAVKTRLNEVEAQMPAVRVGKEDTEERRELSDANKKLTSECEQAEAEIGRLRGSDPSSLAELKQNCEKLNEDIDRWTDNVMSIKKWCKRKFSLDDKTLNKQFGIPSDFEDR